MRLKLLLVFYLLLFVTQTKAQNYVLDSIVCTKDGVKTMTKINYNSAKNQLVLLEYESLKATSDLTNQNKMVFRFNKDTLQTKTVVYSWNNSLKKWDKTQNNKYKYERYLGLNELIERVQFNKHEGKMRRDNSYNKIIKNNSTIEIHSRIEGNKFEPVDKVITINNSANKPLSVERFVWNSKKNSLEKESLVEYKYVNDSTLVLSEIKYWNGNSWDNVSKTEYEQSANGNYSQQTYFESVNNQWVFNYKSETIKYPHQNKEIFKYYSYKDGEWVLEVQDEVLFNDNGETLDSKFFRLNNTTNTLEKKITIVDQYNTEGLLMYSERFDYENDEIAFGSRIINTYDEKWNILKATYSNYDGTENIWTKSSETQYLYEYIISIDANSLLNYVDYGLTRGLFYDYYHSKIALKNVKRFDFENGIKTLVNECEYFYTK